MGSRVSRHRVACLIEESLRLAHLPGEDEGRVYYFQRVSMASVVPNASRQEWIGRMDQALRDLAEQAVHGADPRAGSSNAVYFHNYQEALEILLCDSVRAPDKCEWFWASVLGCPLRASSRSLVPTILESLRAQPISRHAVALTILSALSKSDPVRFLAAIPAVSVSTWLREMDESRNTAGLLGPAQIPQRLADLVLQCANEFGWQDVRTIWTASLVVASVSPADVRAGTVVKQARAMLQQLTLTHLGQSALPDRDVPRKHCLSAPNAESSEFELTSEANHTVSFTDEDPSAQSSLMAAAENVETSPTKNNKSAGASEASSLLDAIEIPALLGEPTAGGGLYFLLNALRYMGIAKLLAACPELVEAGFVDHLLRSLAAHAEVNPADPILSCISSNGEFSLSADTLATLLSNPQAWPENFRLKRESFDAGRFLRIWAIAVRRWCWGTGKITVRDMVNRKGLVWLTRADLDVTLPLHQLDIRIRRVGLDIDPGWVPWLGKFGRVVRFHYRDHGWGRRC